MTFLFSWFGEGRLPAGQGSGSVRRLSPKMSLKAFAMLRCCTREQWFSMERMSGYLQHDCCDSLPSTTTTTAKSLTRWK